MVPIVDGRRGNPIVLDQVALARILESGLNLACRHLLEREPDVAHAYETTNSRFVTAEHTRIYSPAVLGATHFSFSRTHNTAYDRALPGFTFPRFTFGGAPDVPGRITIGGGYSAWGGNNFNPKDFVQNLNWIKGAGRNLIVYCSTRHAAVLAPCGATPTSSGGAIPRTLIGFPDSRNNCCIRQPILLSMVGC